MTELIIGRQAGVERPRLSIQHEGKTIPMGDPGSVPKNVSRRHCRILIDDDFNISIEDLTADNFMFVNGVECKRKNHVKMEDLVELGPDRYRLDLETIIKHFTAKRSYHIGHLKFVYDNYQKAIQDRQVKQGKMNSLSAIPGVLSMSSIAMMAAFTDKGDTLRTVMIVIAVAFSVAFAVMRWGSAKSSPEERGGPGGGGHLRRTPETGRRFPCAVSLSQSSLRPFSGQDALRRIAAQQVLSLLQSKV